MPPGGRQNEHVGGHVLYGMMMMAVGRWFIDP
jgi:hypothetical protein